MKRTLLSLAAGLSLLAALPASAALIIDGGVAGQIGDFGAPGFDVVQDNNVVVKLLGNGVKLDGFFNATLRTDTKTNLEVMYLGKEAGFKNTFSIGGHSDLFVTKTTKVDGNIISLSDVFDAGVIDFSFSTYRFGATVVDSVNNGANNPHTVNDVVDFWLGEKDGWIWIAMDDGFGPATGDNHDDLVLKIRAVPVPEPMGLALMGLGLVGVAAAARRRKA